MRKWIGFQGRGPDTPYKRHIWDSRNRYALLFDVMLRTGGGISEILGLRLKDVDPNTNTLKLRMLKRRNEEYRVVLIIET